MELAETQRTVASFLVRFTQDLWQDADGDPRVHWRGHVTHVQGDDEARFTDFTEAVTFIQGQLAQLTLEAATQTPTPMDQEKTLRESFKLWEQFATSYSDLLIEATGQAAQQSRRFQEQVQEQMDQVMQQATIGWRAPVASAEVQALQAQVKALTQRVEALENERRNDPKG